MRQPAPFEIQQALEELWPTSKVENCMTNVQNAGLGAISRGPVSAVSLVILGQLCSMKNRRRQLRNRRTGKMFSAKSTDAMRYMADFCAQVPVNLRGLMLGTLEQPLRLSGTVYYRSRRSDLDIELLKDCLQTARVIRNDRDIIQERVDAAVDKKNPRVEITLELI